MCKEVNRLLENDQRVFVPTSQLLQLSPTALGVPRSRNRMRYPFRRLKAPWPDLMAVDLCHQSFLHQSKKHTKEEASSISELAAGARAPPPGL